MKKKALITGITGQDGHHLTTFLTSREYEVIGLVSHERDQRHSSFTTKFPDVRLLAGDLSDYESLRDVIGEVEPDEIYNLAALSFVVSSFNDPERTADVTGLGALRLFEAVRSLDALKECRIYQASSSEMFGQAEVEPQNENTPFKPVSPYAVSKVFAHHSAQMYRNAYGMHISCGILFNHEGEYRGHEFVTRKISSNVARVALGKQANFALGALTPQRDWGYAGDYVEAMWLMLQQEIPDDYVIATGLCHSVYEFVEVALRAAGLQGKVEDYVTLNPELIRPAEVSKLRGDASKAERILGWSPRVDFKGLVELMVKSDMAWEAEN
jgi:GDPmannose 4,6-dehydratase